MLSPIDQIKYLSGLITEEDMQGALKAQPADINHPVVDGEPVPPAVFHLDFYNWLVTQDMDDFHLNELFVALKNSIIMVRFLKEYGDPRNFQNGKFKSSVGMGQQRMTL